MTKVIFVKDSASEVLAQVQGELDSTAVENFNEQIASVLNNAGRAITFDFTELSFISSAGLRSLLLINKKAQANGGSVTISGACPEIKHVFNLTGFDTFMTVE